MRMLVAALTVAATVAVAPVAAQTSTTWKRYEAQGLSLQLPPSWVDASKDRAKLLAEVRRLYADDADLAAIMDGMLAAGRGNAAVKMIAFDLAPASLRTGFATNLNVIRERTALPLAAWRKATLKALAAMSFVVQPIWSETIKLGGGKAVRLRYHGRFTLRGKTLETAFTQYAIVRDGSAYVLTYTTLPKLTARYRADFERSARSFRLVKSS